MSSSSPDSNRRSPIEAAQVVEDLRAEISELSQQTRMLRMAIDEYHTDFVWVMRNLPEWLAAAVPAEAVAHFRTAAPQGEGQQSAFEPREVSEPLPSSGNQIAKEASFPGTDTSAMAVDRATVIEAYIEYLADFEEAAEPPDDELRRALYEHHLFIPDLVSGGSPDQFIAVRPTLTPRERDDMAKWIEVLGGDCEAVRVWPDNTGATWSWKVELVATSDDSIDLATENADLEETESETTAEAAAPASDAATGNGMQTRMPAAKSPPSTRPPQLTPPPSPKRRRQAQPLYMRVVFQPVMTDVVRLFGYQELTQEVAAQRLQPLIEKYGEVKVREALEEVAEAVPGGGILRLRAEVRQACRHVLGPAPAQLPAANENFPENMATAGEAAAAANESPRPRFPLASMVTDGKAISGSCKVLASQAMEFLQAAGCPLQPISAPTLQRLKSKGRTPPDFALVQEGAPTIYALVRRKLTPPMSQDVSCWRHDLGESIRAVRLWPVQGDNGRRWMYEWLTS